MDRRLTPDEVTRMRGNQDAYWGWHAPGGGGRWGWVDGTSDNCWLAWSCKWNGSAILHAKRMVRDCVGTFTRR